MRGFFYLLAAMLMTTGCGPEKVYNPETPEIVRKRPELFASVSDCSSIYLRKPRIFSEGEISRLREYESWSGNKIRLEHIAHKGEITAVRVCILSPDIIYPGYENDIASLLD